MGPLPDLIYFGRINCRADWNDCSGLSGCMGYISTFYRNIKRSLLARQWLRIWCIMAGIIADLLGVNWAIGLVALLPFTAGLLAKVRLKEKGKSGLVN